MKFDEENFAHEYEKRLSKEGYPGILLNRILCEIQGAKSVIDVGAGTGFFSIPLAEMDYRITAIEPSVKMAAILRKKINKKISHLINLDITDWESWEGKKADWLISIHSIYGMKELKEAVEKMSYYSNKSAIIIKADSGTISLSEIIRKRLKKDRCSYGFFSRIDSVLREIGLDYSFYEIEQRRESQFSNIEKEAEYYCRHLELEEENLNVIRRLLIDNSERISEGYIFRAIYKDILFLF